MEQSLFLGHDTPSSWTDPACITLSPAACLCLFSCSVLVSLALSPVPAGHAALPFVLFSDAGGCWAAGPASTDVKLPGWRQRCARASIHPSLCHCMSGHTCPLYWALSW